MRIGGRGDISGKHGIAKDRAPAAGLP